MGEGEMDVKLFQGLHTYDKWVTYPPQTRVAHGGSDPCMVVSAEALSDEFRTVIQAITCPTYNRQWSGNHAYLPTGDSPFIVHEVRKELCGQVIRAPI